LGDAMSRAMRIKFLRSTGELGGKWAPRMNMPIHHH
jgi:hypothetical protein